MTAYAPAEKKRVSKCPTCGGPVHRDPVTKRFTRHPDDLPPPEVVEEAITTIERSGKPRRRLFGRKRNA